MQENYTAGLPRELYDGAGGGAGGQGGGVGGPGDLLQDGSAYTGAKKGPGAYVLESIFSLLDVLDVLDLSSLPALALGADYAADGIYPGRSLIEQTSGLANLLTGGVVGSPFEYIDRSASGRKKY